MTTEAPEDRDTEIWRTVLRKVPSVVAREIAGETFLVPVRGELAQLQQLFALNAVGAFIWEQVDGKNDLATIHGLLIERFEVAAGEARDDLLEYVERLRDAQLIETVENS